MSSNSKEENQETSWLESLKDFFKEYIQNPIKEKIKQTKNWFLFWIVIILLIYSLDSYKFELPYNNHIYNINLSHILISLLAFSAIYNYYKNQVNKIHNLYECLLILYLIYELSTNTLNTIINNLKLIHIIILFMILFFIYKKFNIIKDFFLNCENNNIQINLLTTYIIFTFLLYFTKDLKLNTIFSNKIMDIELINFVCIIILFGLFCKFIIKKLCNTIKNKLNCCNTKK